LSFSSHLLSFIKIFFLRIKTIKIVKRRRKGDVKTLSLRLNIKPYNRLDKEVIDFKEYKEELIMPHNIEYFYLRAGILKK